MGLARIADFKDRLAEISADDRSRVWSVALNELRHLKTASWTPAGAEERVQGYATTTLRSVLSDYRNAVREDERFGSDHPVLVYLRPSLSDQQAVRADSFDAVLERGAKENRRAIDPEELVDTAMRLLDEPEDGNRLPLKTAGLLLLTGRRTIELFRGELVAPPRELAHDGLLDGARGATLVFGGQAKSRLEDQTAYEIPVLGDPARVLRALQELQREYPAIAELEAKFPNLGDRDINKKLDGKVASRLGDYVRDAFSDSRGGTLTPKDLRAVYAATAWDWYAREQSPQPSFNAFVARALGHGEKDVGTALSYQQFYVVGASRTFDRAYRRANVHSAALLDADARMESDERRRGFIEENAHRFRDAAGGMSPSIGAPESKRSAEVTEQGPKVDRLEGNGKTKGSERNGTVAIDQAEIAPAEAPATPAAAPEGAGQERAAERQSTPATSRRQAAAARNKVELVGTLERVTPGNRPGTPTRLEVEVTNGNFKDTLAVSAFREAGESAKELEPGTRVAIDGYLAIRKVERDGQSRTIAGVTANAIEGASPDQPDRNYARVVGNVAQEPRFRESERGPFAALSVATGPEKFADIVGYGSQATEIRDTLGRGDGIAVEGRVRPQEGRDGFPASVQVVANEIELEHKKQPRLELEGRLTRDPQIGEGPKATRVAFSIAINEMIDGKEQTEYKNVVAFADKGAAWPSDLKKGTEVRVTGREDSSPYEKDGEQRTFEFVRADRVERVEREHAHNIGQSPAQSAGVGEDVSGAASDKVVTEPDVATREAGGVAAEAPAPADAAQLASVELPTGVGDAAAPAVELDALARQIARTDWTFAFSDDPRVFREGAAAVDKTLATVAESARLDPEGTRALVERFAAQNGEQSPDVVDALRGAVDRGLGVEAEAPRPTVDLSRLPIFEPGANDVVDRREDFTLSMDQTMTVSGRSEDGQRVFGRDGGGVLSVSKELFSDTPSVDDKVTISRGPDGKDRAQLASPEVALER